MAVLSGMELDLSGVEDCQYDAGRREDGDGYHRLWIRADGEVIVYTRGDHDAHCVPSSVSPYGPDRETSLPPLFEGRDLIAAMRGCPDVFDSDALEAALQPLWAAWEPERVGRAEKESDIVDTDEWLSGYVRKLRDAQSRGDGIEAATADVVEYARYLIGEIDDATWTGKYRWERERAVALLAELGAEVEA